MNVLRRGGVRVSLALGMIFFSVGGAAYWKWHVAHRLSAEFAADASAYLNLQSVNLSKAEVFLNRAQKEKTTPADREFFRALEVTKIKADLWEGAEVPATNPEELEREHKTLLASGGLGCFAALKRAAHERWWGPAPECSF